MKFVNYLILAVTLAFASSAFGEEEAKRKKIELNEDNVVFFGEAFNWRSVAKLQAVIAEKDERLPSHKPIYIVIDSGGGSISAGLELITNVAAYKRKIHTITLFGASMAFQTVQGLGDRYVTDSGTLMSHKARGGFYGEFPGQLDSRYGFWLRKLTLMDQKTVDRSGGKLTLESYRNLYENEYWCDGQDCVDKGVADAVADVTCDETLSGAKEEKIQRFWRGRRVIIKVIKAACPLVTGIIDFKVQVDGRDFLKGRTYYDDDKKAMELAENQRLWTFIQTQLTKPAHPDRVIYMNVPARGPDSIGPEMTPPTK